jgi:predicted RNase H-like nuclease (RuvC/YqgF family)
METVETIFRKLRAENNRLREENYDLTLTFLLSKEKADDKIVRLQTQLKFFQDDAMGDVKTIDHLSKMALANSDLQMHYDYAKDECDKLREVLKELEWQLKNQLYDAAYETVIHTLWPQLKEKE